jgi:glyoxylase-like metal-dependent hydrolase (beta-lactamase superfamily II)
MKNYICENCGTQYEETFTYPEKCIICSDERQYVPLSVQKWTTLEELFNQDYRNIIREVEPGLYSIKTVPQVGIGQSAYFITTEYGNILWDCITYLDESTKQWINSMGGISGIILSHPHYYSTIVEWANTFDCSIYIHDEDKEWVTRDSSRYVFWKGESHPLSPEVEIIHLGGHFEGSSVLLWKNGSEGKGALLVGDTIFIVPDQGWLSFLYSHPNRIPLSSYEVRNMMEKLTRYTFEAIYGAFDNSIPTRGKDSVLKSGARYIYHLERKHSFY